MRRRNLGLFESLILHRHLRRTPRQNLLVRGPFLEDASDLVVVVADLTATDRLLLLVIRSADSHDHLVVNVIVVLLAPVLLVSLLVPLI